VQVVPGIHRVGGDSIVNSYLLAEGDEVTIVDAGAPGLWSRVPAELAAMGRSLDDVRAIVLTHGHPDHVGYAERARRERGWPVMVHDADAALARGELPNPSKATGMRPLPLLAFTWWGIRHGLLRVPPLAEVATYGDGATLDVPGSPRVVLAPGHTAGSAVLHVASHDVVFAGDVLVTFGVVTADRGPMLSPFSVDRAQAPASLDRLEGLDARLVLPGHGEPFDGGIAEAVRLARAHEARA
jgi:glyoxylase-like metal-dependent hydrolase (beta-lactamase superfamily II)